MSYITGDIENYEKRVHQFCDSSSALDTFILERGSYSPSANLLDTFIKEENKKKSLLHLWEPEYDSTAQAYFDAVEAAGGNLGSMASRIVAKTAISDFIVAEKAAGRWDKIKRFRLPVWGVAAASAICLKSLEVGTWVNSSTHAAGYFNGDGSTSYFACDSNPFAQGLSINSAMNFYLVYGKPTLPLSGSFNNGYSNVGGRLFSMRYGNLAGNQCYFGIHGTEVGTASTGFATGEAILLFSRTISTHITAVSCTSLGVNSLSVANSSIINPAALSPYVGALNANETASSFHNQKIGAFGYGTGFSQAEGEAFVSNLKTMWETVTTLTLP